MAGHSIESGRSVASKVAAILLACSADRSWSLSELARATGLPISTMHRLISELVAHRLLERTLDGNYRAGLPLRTIAAAAAGPRSVIERLRVALQEFTETIHSAVRLGIVDEGEILQAEFIPGSPPPQGFQPPEPEDGRSALGRVLLSFADSRRTASNRGVGHGAASGLSHAAVRAAEALPTRRASELVVRRNRSHSDDTSGAIAMPVFGPGGGLHAAAEVSVPDLGSDLDRIRIALAVVTTSLSRDLAAGAYSDRARATG